MLQKTTQTFFAALTVLVMVGSANAEPLVYEGLQYGAGEKLEGQPNGAPEVDATGLAGKWSIDNVGNDWTIQSESLLFGDLPTLGGHVTNGNDANAYRDSDVNWRGLTADAQTGLASAGEVWFSILAKLEVPPASWGAAEDGCALTNQPLTSPRVRANSGDGLAGFGIGAEGFADFQPYAWDGTDVITGTDANPALDTVVGQTYLLVGNIVFDSGTGGADAYTLYNYELNGDTVVDGTLTQIGDTLEVDVTQADLDTVTLTRQRSVAYDELRIGTSLADVVPGVPEPEPDLPGDANGNGFVDDDDLAILLSNWEQDVGTITTWELGDFTKDTDVDDDDLAVLLGNWTGPPPGGAAVPEPATLALMGLGGLMIARRRRARAG